MQFHLGLFEGFSRLSRSFQIDEEWICRDSNSSLRKNDRIPQNERCKIQPGRVEAARSVANFSSFHLKSFSWISFDPVRTEISRRRGVSMQSQFIVFAQNFVIHCDDFSKLDWWCDTISAHLKPCSTLGTHKFGHDEFFHSTEEDLLVREESTPAD